jgi:response regulator of citrate/malate metabolism
MNRNDLIISPIIRELTPMFLGDLAVMSSQDSIKTVYKCMLRGAADYLVKPIRKNELRNLWQHVWRKQSVCLLCT